MVFMGRKAIPFIMGAKMENIKDFYKRFIEDMEQVEIDQKDEFTENFWKGVNFTVDMIRERLKN